MSDDPYHHGRVPWDRRAKGRPEAPRDQDPRTLNEWGPNPEEPT